MAISTPSLISENKKDRPICLHDGSLRSWLLLGPFDRNAVDKTAREAPAGILDVLKKMTDAELVEIRSITKERKLSRPWVCRHDPELAERFERLDIGIADAPGAAAKPAVDETALRPAEGCRFPSEAVVSGMVEWFPHTASSNNEIDLSRALWQYDATPMANLAGKPDGSTGYMASLAAYAAVFIESPEAATVSLRLQWNGMGAIILNGEVLEKPIARSSHLKSEDSWNLPLRQGENLLIIRLAGPNEQGPRKRNWGWGFAARFENAEECRFYLPLATSKDALTAELRTTPFFLHGQSRECDPESVGSDGDLFQVFHLIIRWDGEPALGSARLHAGGEEYALDLGEVDLGVSRFDFPIPAPAAPVSGDLQVRVGESRAVVPVQLTPSVRYKILVTESSHLDTGFTDPQDQVSDIRIRILDDVIRFIDEEKDPDYHFTEEGMWSVQQYLEARSPEKIERLMQLAREGRIELAVMNSSISAWTTGDEELCRELERAKRIQDRYGIALKSACFIDTPGVGWGLAEVLHRAGIRYLVNGMNESFNGRSFETSLPREFWWETPSGGKILVAAFRGYYAPIDLHPNGGIPALRHILNQRIHEKEADHEPGDYLFFFGSNYDNVPPDLDCAKAFREWNAHYAYPRFVLGTLSQTLGYVEQNAGSELPVLRGDWAGYWDGSHHGAATDCPIRENLVIAEKLLSILSLRHPESSPHSELLNQAYQLEIDSKTHGSNGTAFGTDEEVEQSHRWFLARRQMAAALAESLMTRALRAAGNLLASAQSGLWFVYNPSSWPRDGIVELESRSRLEPSGQAPLALRDSETGEIHPLRVETISSRVFMGPPREGARARFLARQVPPMGFKAFEIIPAPAKLPPTDLLIGPHWIENSCYRIEANPSGTITSIFDKNLQAEIVHSNGTAPFAQTAIIEHPRGGWRPAPKTESVPEEAQVEILNEAPLRISIVITKKSTVTLRSEVSLLPGSDVIYFRDEILPSVADAAAPTHRSLAKSFCFALTAPNARLKVSNAVMTPGVDQLPGAGHRGTYIPQYGGVLENENRAIAWAAFGVSHVQFAGCTISQLRQPPLPDNPTLRFSATVPGQRQRHAAPVAVRYALRSLAAPVGNHAFYRLGIELAQPLLSIRARGHEKIPTAPAQALFTVAPEEVAIQTVKASIDGNGWCLRLINTGPKDICAEVCSPFFEGARAFLSDLLERLGEKLEIQGEILRVPMPGNATITVLFYPQGGR